jgi:hypothetical protein
MVPSVSTGKLGSPPSSSARTAMMMIRVLADEDVSAPRAEPPLGRRSPLNLHESEIMPECIGFEIQAGHSII